MTYSKSLKIDGLFREEQWNYPQVAVREGIMNAIVHRDYNSVNGFMHILQTGKSRKFSFRLNENLGGIKK